jgi:Ca2+/Na+ antiporter
VKSLIDFIKSVRVFLIFIILSFFCISHNFLILFLMIFWGIISSDRFLTIYTNLSEKIGNRKNDKSTFDG